MIGQLKHQIWSSSCCRKKNWTTEFGNYARTSNQMLHKAWEEMLAEYLQKVESYWFATQLGSFLRKKKGDNVLIIIIWSLLYA